jgi:iron complex outermembrane recepter protein
MQGSRSKSIRRKLSRTPLATAILLACPAAALAQEGAQLEEVTVTAQKRTENLQDVPISIQALGNETLKELNIKNFVDYTRMLPAVAAQPSLGAGGGFGLIYMRGIATGGDGQATTSRPSVGTYLDELPVTTIQGNLDVHMYDIARVEALAGPQGTLYGASSQAGTIRLITNKPDPSGFSASYALEGNMVDGDDAGYVAEGYVNLPIGDRAALRLVGWYSAAAGWIDNEFASRTYPGLNDLATCGDLDCAADDITLDNAEFVKDNYNTLDTVGGRAALRIDLNDNWTVSPTVQGQRQESEGFWGDDLSDFASGNNLVTGTEGVSHFSEEFTDDEWYHVGLTIEGTVGNFDILYSGNYLDRQVDGSFDYADYSFFYDSGNTTGYFADLHFADTGPRPYANQFVPDYFDAADVGTRTMTGDYFTNDDGYTKESHEVRISTPQDKRIRGMLGFFWQEQKHDFEQHFTIEGLGTIMEMNGGTDPRFEDTKYLNSMFRDDTDEAVFTSIDFDVTDALTLTLGARFFETESSLKGFFGFGLGFSPIWSGNGEVRCDSFPNGQADFKDKPCVNVDRTGSESGEVGRVNLTWEVSDDHMLYATWSEGYRPGGANRNPLVPNYVSDFLTNWEAGWKTQWMNNRLQFNGAVFLEEWENFQVSFAGLNGITQVENGNEAEVKGTELQLLWAATDNLRVTASAAYYDTELTQDYIGFGGGLKAPTGTRLPLTPEFKGNAVVRYDFGLGSFDAYTQGSVVYIGSRSVSLDVADNDFLGGDLPASTVIDLSAGISKDSYALELFLSNVTDEDAPYYKTSECAADTCGEQAYGVRPRPPTVGLRFTKDF